MTGPQLNTEKPDGPRNAQTDPERSAGQKPAHIGP